MAISDTAAVPARTIPFFNYRAAFTANEREYLEMISGIIRRGAFIQQQELVDFERHLAEYLGVKHAIGVGNATDGLIMAFRAAGLGPGDEVIFPSHTMVASPASAAHTGATPVPVDMGPDHLIDPAAIEAAITPRTRAILPVHLNGRTCAMDPILEIAERHGLMILEDAAQALGSRYKGKYAGTFGVASAISFYPAKILGCFGDGGAVITDDDEIARKVRLLRDHGRNEEGEVECWGLNSRLDNLQAAVLDFQFADYDATIVARRRALAARYDAALRDLTELVLPAAPGADPDHHDVFQNYEIEADRRDDLRAFLKDRGVGTLIQWGGKAVHQFKGLGYGDVSLPRTERFFERCLMLPMNMMVTDEDADYVAATVREFYGR
ncbi:DegT/DnrJ/EryC1/StrS family aminotransferase [Roseisolibacter sp. H3M3-2]|uniref:DegT/DnrJ/EryC1/StrS family aminotransferase n=1 Tax=Roseisolibacter sp. H3M3-2 TaxID=3031323 RepID=UPI0023DBCF22|nr:DegT/DnrJ/EryC1/StrS family aminotransferase [Roseisolibacter sp. H3M3-2]MDF1502340.1 DegT/DnrJ/EryC1/StrS family aminotransferase [Roseisolibacter sp. H3M3-2]